MDMLNESELQVVVDKIMTRITITSDGCWLWPSNKPHIQTSRRSTGYGVVPVLWQHKHGHLPSGRWGHGCVDAKKCVNPDHKHFGWSRTSSKGHKYVRHTQACGGIDPVVIERVVAAGTVDILPPGHMICECERAYIIKYVEGAKAILGDMNGQSRRRLAALDV